MNKDVFYLLYIGRRKFAIQDNRHKKLEIAELVAFFHKLILSFPEKILYSFVNLGWRILFYTKQRSK